VREQWVGEGKRGRVIKIKEHSFYALLNHMRIEHNEGEGGVSEL
jgi:hypothetical protein